MKSNIFLSLGSNKGDKLSYLNSALELLQKNNIHIIRKSSIIETEPYGVKQQDSFFNLVVEIKTDLEPSELLLKIKNIEKKVGRTPSYKWGPREIDIDILYYDNLIINKKISEQYELIVPHPDLHNRNFVLIPLLEIAPKFCHPLLNMTNEQLYKILNSNS